MKHKKLVFLGVLGIADCTPGREPRSVAASGILSMTKEFDLLTFKYDVVTGQCNVCDIRETFLLIFITLSQVRLVLTRFFFFSLFPFFASLRCFAL